MPFTGSHPAAVLPFSRTSLPLSALVIGSMVPDLPFYVPTPYRRGLSHRFAGVVTVDLAAGLLVHEAWLRVVGPAVRAYAPPAIAERVTLARPDAVRVVAGIGLGALTHVVWDAFTHDGVWGVELLPALNARLGPLPAYEWAQYASGVFGAATIAWWAWRCRHSPVTVTTPPRRSPLPVAVASSSRRPHAVEAPSRPRRAPSPASSPHPQLPVEVASRPRRFVVSAVVALAAVAGGALGFRYGLGWPDPVRRAFYYGATWGVDAGVGALAAAAGIGRLRARAGSTARAAR